MAYIKKKGVSSEPKAEKLPYKGGGGTAEKLPYRGTNEAKPTPLKQEAKRKAVASNKKMMRTATPISEKKKMMKTATPRSSGTTKTFSGTGVSKLKNDIR